MIELSTFDSLKRHPYSDDHVPVPCMWVCVHPFVFEFPHMCTTKCVFVRLCCFG